MTTEEPTLHYAPRSRATATRVLLEELGAPHDLNVLNIRKGAHKAPAFLAINPLGKVPALSHGDTILTESVAIALYLGDLFSEAGLTPLPGDPRRGAYLRWMVFYAASFEPALMDKMCAHVPPANECAYGTFDQVIELLANQLGQAPYILGDEITVADIQWGATLEWALAFKAIPELPVFRDYATRVTSRASFQRVFKDEVRLGAEHEAAAA
ncbi:glutathione S-transferase family protein [Stappia stellulata]|uniref:glutathione S-transferase family protein n=1 Tax=Stappia stellulata TaxID=71235 RepID=UPI0003F5B6B8|nr:glutathione S-transferase family protein [Stappia stellulata]